MYESLIEITVGLRRLGAALVDFLEFSKHRLNDLNVGFYLGHSYGFER